MIHNRSIAAFLGTFKSLAAFLISLSISLIIVRYTLAAVLVFAIVISTTMVSFYFHQKMLYLSSI